MVFYVKTTSGKVVCFPKVFAILLYSYLRCIKWINFLITVSNLVLFTLKSYQYYSSFFVDLFVCIICMLADALRFFPLVPFKNVKEKKNNTMYCRIGDFHMYLL